MKKSLLPLNIFALLTAVAESSGFTLIIASCVRKYFNELTMVQTPLTFNSILIVSAVVILFYCYKSYLHDCSTLLMVFFGTVPLLLFVGIVSAGYSEFGSLILVFLLQDMKKLSRRDKGETAKERLLDVRESQNLTTQVKRLDTLFDKGNHEKKDSTP